MINRMVEPTSGTITVDGKDVTSVPAAQLRRSMGYVMQSSGLMPHRSVLDNIATVPRLNGVSKSESRKRAEELLDVVGLASVLGKRYPSQLSGGQQQRVACARALVARPEVIFADEPTGNLDSASGAEVLGFLRRSVTDMHQTIVMVTHDPNAASYADRVLFLADGHIVDEMLEPTADAVLDRMKKFEIVHLADDKR
jgi:osmoprotectant transport system ATP-binding protein